MFGSFRFYIERLNMAFNINAQIILKAPKDIGKISKSIQSQLSKAGSINVGVDKNLNRSLSGINKSLTGLNKNIGLIAASTSKTSAALARLNTLNAVTAGSSKALTNQQNQLATANNNVGKSANQAAGGLTAFGKQAAASLRSAAAFAVTTRAVFGLTGAIKSGVKDATEFERSLIKISQVTGDSIAGLQGLKDTINTLSTDLGINANELVEVARTLAQTGQTAREVKQSLDALAKSSLAPTFGDIKQTTEGLIASLAQFRIEASQSEEVLASLNAVSKRFAVESEDLISAIRRAGGVFSTAATDAKSPIEALQQLSAVFTSVRSVTRESAETIATGLRTIFTRIQRRGTIEFLKQFGIELVNAEGQFVGLFEAFKRLSAGLDDIIQKGDALTLSAITEELGGVRQVGKLIPAITNFANAQEALKVAQEGAAAGLTGDVDKALGGLAKRFEQTQARFQELVRSITESKTFQNLARLALSTADAFISLADKLKPLLPLIATVGASFIAKGAAQFAGGFVGAIGGGGLKNIGSTLGGGGGGGQSQATAQNTQAISQNTQITNQLSNIFQSVDNGLDKLNLELASFSKTLTTQMSNLIQALGGFGARGATAPVRGFARGGIVPGTGNSDTVPAMLTPGEFVIRKGSVGKIGAGTLQQMNENGYADGGIVVQLKNPNQFGAFISQGPGGEIAGRAAGNLVDPSSRSESFVKSVYNALESQQKSPTVSEADKRRLLEGQTLYGKTGAPVGDFKKFLQKPGNNKLDPNSQDATNAFADFLGSKKASGLAQIGSNVQSAADLKKIPVSIRGPFQGLPIGGDLNEELAPAFNAAAEASLTAGVQQIANSDVVKKLDIPPAINADETKLFDSYKTFFDGARETLEGFLLEGTIGALTNATVGGGGTNFDFPDLGSDADATERLAKLFQNDTVIQSLKKADAKRQLSTAREGEGRLVNKIAAQGSLKSSQFNIVKKNSGGSISGQDTVPAMLTPGEFVFNKKAASRIGYGTLNKMNKQGVTGFNKGGIVGVQRFAEGGEIVDARFGSIGDQIIREEKEVAAALARGADAFDNIDFKAENLEEASNSLKVLGETSEKAASAQEKATKETEEGAKRDAQTALLRQQSFQQLASAASVATTAIATFDISNPLASITSLGFAAFEATNALEAIKDTGQDIGGFGESLIKFKDEFQGGLTDAFSPSRLKDKFDPETGKQTQIAAGKRGNRFGLKGASIGKIAGRAAAGGAAAAAVAAAVGPVVDSITDTFAGAKQEIEGFSGRANTTGDEAAIIGGIGEGLKGAAAGAAAGLVFGPVGAAIGGVIGGVGGAIIGSFEASLQQEAFNALSSLKQASEDAAKGLDAFNAKTDVTSSDIDEVNQRLSNLTSEIGPTLEKTFTASLGITGGLAVAAGDDPGGAVFGRSLADGIDGADLATLAASPITAIITLGNTFQDLAGQAGEFIGIGSEAGQAIAGFVNPLSNLGTVLGTVTNFGLEMFGLDAATQAATATAESFEAVLNTVGPENIEKANEALGKSAAQFVKDLDTLGDTDAIDALANLSIDTTFASETSAEFGKLNQVLDQSANNGNKFASALKDQLAQTSKLNILKGVKDQIDLLVASGDKAAAADLGKAFSQLQNVSPDKIEQAAFALESTGAIGTTAAETIAKLGNEEAKRTLALLQQQAAQAKANRLLEEARRSIDGLAEGLNKFTNVANGAAQQFDIFTNNLTQSVDQAFSDVAGGFQIERFDPFENLDISTDFDISKAFEEFRGLTTDQGAADTAFAGLEDFAKLQRDVPFLLKDALTQSIASGGLGETASPEEVLEKIQESLQDVNIQIPDVALNALSKNLQAQAATEQGGELPVTNIIRALEEGGDLADLFGEIGSKFQDALAGVRSAQDTVTNNLLRISDLQLKLARQDREFRLGQVKRAQATEERIAKIRGKSATNQLGQAQTNLNQQAVAIAGSADPTQLLGRRQAAINERNVLQTQLQTGRTATGAVASQQQQKDAADKLAKLNNEFESTTQALNLLANETDRLAAIEAEAAAAKEKENQALGGGIGLFKKLQEEAKTGVADRSIDEDIAPIASLQKALGGGALNQDEALNLLDQLNSGNNDLLKVALNRAKAESPGLDENTLIENLFTGVAEQVAGLQGAKERGLGGDSGFIKDVLVQQFKDAKSESEKLASAAESIFAQQTSILEQVFQQNRQQAVQALAQADAAFLDSVTKFDEAVQQFADLRAREADTREAQEVTAEAERQKQKVQEESTASIDQKIAEESEAIVSAGLPEELERLRAQYRKNIEDARESGGNVSFFEETLADEAGLRVQAQANLEKKVQAQKAEVEARVRKEEADRVLAEQQAIEDAKNKKLAEISGRGAEREAKRKQEREARAAGTQTQTGIPTGIATPVSDLEADLKSKEAEAEQAKQNLQDAVAKDPGAGFEIANLENIAAQAQQDVEDAKAKLQQAGGAAGAGGASDIIANAAAGLPDPEEIYQNALAAGNPYAERFNPANQPATIGSTQQPQQAAQTRQQVAAQTAGPIRGAASGQIQPFSRVAQQAQGEIGVLQQKLEAAGGFSEKDQQRFQELSGKDRKDFTRQERREFRSLQQRQTFSSAIGQREKTVEGDAFKQKAEETFKKGGELFAVGLNAGIEGLKTAAGLIPETINTTLGGEVTVNLLGTQGLEDAIVEKVQQVIKEQIAPLLPNNSPPQEGQIGSTPNNK